MGRDMNRDYIGSAKDARNNQKDHWVSQVCPCMAKSYLQKRKGLQDCSVPVIHLASHSLVYVSQSNAQQGQRLMWVQSVGVEILPQCLRLCRLQHRFWCHARHAGRQTGAALQTCRRTSTAMQALPTEHKQVLYTEKLCCPSAYDMSPCGTSLKQPADVCCRLCRPGRQHHQAVENGQTWDRQ